MRGSCASLAAAAVIAVLTAGIAGPVARADAGEDEAVVNCYDEARQIVQKTLNGSCRGKVVDAAEAARIEAKRRAYIQRAFEKPSPIAPRKRLKGVGTGFFIDGDGTLMTNNHVVADCAVVSVAPTSGDRAEAEVVATNKGVDLAVLRAALKPPGYARFAAAEEPSEGVAVGIVGYPDQGIPPIKPLFTAGETAGAREVGNNAWVLQIRAAVRPGNSGGPVLDPAGRVIGVVFAKVDTPGVYERTGTVVRDVGYVIPSRLARMFLDHYRVRYHRAAAGDGEPAADLLEHARPFVARVECWK